MAFGEKKRKKQITATPTPRDGGRPNRGGSCSMANTLARQHGGKWVVSGRTAVQTKNGKVTEYRMSGRGTLQVIRNDVTALKPSRRSRPVKLTEKKTPRFKLF